MRLPHFVMRATPEDLARIELIRLWLATQGKPATKTAAVREALERLAREIEETEKKPAARA